MSLAAGHITNRPLSDQPFNKVVTTEGGEMDERSEPNRETDETMRAAISFTLARVEAET